MPRFIDTTEGTPEQLKTVKQLEQAGWWVCSRFDNPDGGVDITMKYKPRSYSSRYVEILPNGLLQGKESAESFLKERWWKE